MCHPDKAFIGLSYSELYVPAFDAEFSRLPFNLKPKHFQDFLKRVRKKVEPLKLRFYGVGEYGDQSWRPHYHVILFGYPTCVRARTLRDTHSSRPVAYRCCEHCALVQSAWPWGDVDLGSVTRDSASYCAEYTVKKMTAADDKRLRVGNVFRHPEFCRMSLRPGIGVDGMWDVASKLMEYGLDESMVDVPSSLAHGRSNYPLGRYLRGKLREMVGKDKKAPPEALEAIKAELSPLRKAAFDASRSFKEELVRASDGDVAHMKIRSEIYKRRKSQ